MRKFRYKVSMAFFSIPNLKMFSWCNVIQQIKTPSPYRGKRHPYNERFFVIVDQHYGLLVHFTVSLMTVRRNAISGNEISINPESYRANQISR